MFGQKLRHIAAARLSVLREWIIDASKSSSVANSAVCASIAGSGSGSRLHAADGVMRRLLSSHPLIDSSVYRTGTSITRGGIYGTMRGFSSDDGAGERRAKIQDLLKGLSADDASFDREKAEEFVDSFFDDQSMDKEEEGLLAFDEEDAVESDGDDHAIESDGDEQQVVDESAGAGEMEKEDIIMRELRGLRRGSRRVVLQKLLQGGILQSDPAAAEELKKIEKTFRPPSGFRMKVVHINRTCKGTRSGGLFRFSALVVVGNGEGVLGWGSGKSVEVGHAVQKAHQSAYKNLYPVPRHNNHTVTEPVTATFGKTKVIMYPKSSGRGIVANPMLAGICRLAGIHDVGIKVHGSRNPQNTVKCLFAAFDKLRSQDEIVGFRDGVLTVQVPTGRFGQLNLPRV
ncbi:hypothetical protein M9435_001132 [Picochlorum sp. BPE23]|nr:hypothetical protein M9435_001132 [Picochlorum sp. BPE23]